MSYKQIGGKVFIQEVWCITPHYESQLVELDITETCYMAFWSLKFPDFRNVIFEILKVSFCNPPAIVHGRSSPKAGWLCTLAGGLQEDTFMILRIIFLKSGNFRDQNGVWHISVMSNQTHHYYSNLGCLGNPFFYTSFSWQ